MAALEQVDGAPPNRFGFSPRALIRDEMGRVLMLRRVGASGSWPGCWELPGGKPDPGEGLDTALIREVHEETGLAIELIDLAGSARTDLSLSEGIIRIVFVVMSARVVSGGLTLSDEHDQSRWVGATDLAELRLVEPIRGVVEQALDVS